MEPRHSFVKAVEAYVSTYDGRVSMVTVELDCGYRYTSTVDEAPRVGDPAVVTVSFEDGQESFDLFDARSAVADFGARMAEAARR